MTNKKTVLAKRGRKALFLYEQFGTVGFVVGTLDSADKDKEVGETVDYWHWGEYFGDISKALEYLEYEAAPPW